jgi:hypothetical protein
LATVTDDFPEINADETPTVKGPPAENDSNSETNGKTKGTKGAVTPVKKESTKPAADKNAASTNLPKAAKSGPAIWKTKPKT